MKKIPYQLTSINLQVHSQLLVPKPRGLGLDAAESANCLLDSDLLFLLAVPGGT